MPAKKQVPKLFTNKDRELLLKSIHTIDEVVDSMKDLNENVLTSKASIMFELGKSSERLSRIYQDLSDLSDKFDEEMGNL